MKTIKFTCIFAGLIIMSLPLLGQSSITIEASQNATNFKFIDSQGNIDKSYSYLLSGGYAFGYKYQLDQGVFFVGKFGMRNAGASYVYDAMDYSWAFKYGEARIGAGYSYSFNKLSARLLIQGYFAYLLKATQRLNNEYYDIINSNSINSMDYGVFISPGISYSISDYISTYLDLNYMQGIANIETDESQQSNNVLFGATLGVAFNIK